MLVRVYYYELALASYLKYQRCEYSRDLRWIHGLENVVENYFSSYELVASIHLARYATLPIPHTTDTHIYRNDVQIIMYF